MKKIIHLSDLHFGTERQAPLDALVQDIKNIKPDLIIVSGDITQRALATQFIKAKNFLASINNNNVICVPGNHDISLYNVIERFFFTLRKYKKYILPNVYAQYCDHEFAILGINSVTPFKAMSGFVTHDQLEYVEKFFKEYAHCPIKIIVMHHNLIRSKRHTIINAAEEIITIFSRCNVNLILSGHIHAAHIEQLKRSYFSHNMYVVTAGTAISTRTIEPNSYNLIEFSDGQFKLGVREYENTAFVTASEVIFKL